jgi:hypothetical protein
LLSIAIRDLVGPAAGPEEEVDEPRVRERYLTGMLAPRKQEVGDEETEESVKEDVMIDPGEQDELAAAGAGTPEEGTPERGATSSPTLFPCSLGLSFCVAPQASAIRVEARWGQYLREYSEFAKKKDGSPKLVWQRHPRGRTLAPIPLIAGKTIDQSIDSECPEVMLRGQVRRYPDHWSVTLFLVNQQTEPKRRRDEAWVFQPELTVRAPDGGAIFQKRMLPFGRDGCARHAVPRASGVCGRPRSKRPCRGGWHGALRALGGDARDSAQRSPAGNQSDRGGLLRAGRAGT